MAKKKKIEQVFAVPCQKNFATSTELWQKQNAQAREHSIRQTHRNSDFTTRVKNAVREDVHEKERGE